MIVSFAVSSEGAATLPVLCVSLLHSSVPLRWCASESLSVSLHPAPALPLILAAAAAAAAAVWRW